VRDGLIPNLFPEGQNQGLYHTADATLWFFHALHRYVEHCRDRATLALLLPILKGIVRHHFEGTRFGIKVDPGDGLLVQGAEGYALTWMDAKVGDWVVTPRRGKAVEINALWYNALRLLADWLCEAQDPEADELAAHANKTRDSFNRRFWHAASGYLYDVVDGENGDDAAFRPNQILAIALEHPVLDREYWPELTNGRFLSHKRTERERRWARVAEFRRKRRLSLRTALTGNRCFPTGRATTLQIAGNWQIVSLGHHASPAPPMSAYVSNLSVPLLLATKGAHIA
jgi:hypothetical protein